MLDTLADRAAAWSRHEPWPLPDVVVRDPALVLTVAYYYTPENKSILENGVMPTAEVALTPPELGGNDQGPAPLGVNQLPSKDDPVVHRALDLLKNETLKAA